MPKSHKRKGKKSPYFTQVEKEYQIIHKPDGTHDKVWTGRYHKVIHVRKPTLGNSPAQVNTFGSTVIKMLTEQLKPHPHENTKGETG